MNWRARLLLWIAIAFLLLLPSSAFLSTRLLGAPDIDVWNHAWGYWFVFESLINGRFPIATNLIGAPNGGDLYFIDTPGAVASFIATGLFGPAVGYNLTLLMRMALSGFAAQLLTEEWSESGPHSWIAGAAVLSLPFVLCELGNGISEVCAIQWPIFTIWALSRCLRTPSRRNWLFLGLFQGLTITATFYYGMAIGLLLIIAICGTLISRTIRLRHFQSELLIGAIGAAILSLLIASPYAGAFWYTLQSDARLVLRDTSLNEQLLRHNAVDPRIYITFGTFQSVPLQEEYGEPFLHTAYLRWSLIPFAVYSCFQRPDLRFWMFLAVLSLALGLGPYLWWNGDWVMVGGNLISLPFDWLRQLLPQIAITHPLRLSIGGQIILTCLGCIGIHSLVQSRVKHRQIYAFVAIGSIICAEGMWGSSARWPIPSSTAQIPDFYHQDDDRSVLDLPAEAGTSMKTSQYFWFQTAHGRPIPYTPDARLGSTRDLQTFKNFIGSDGITEQPGPLSEQSTLHIRNVYGLVVLHTTLDPEKTILYENVLTEAFGAPQSEEDKLYWLLEPLTSKEQAPTMSSVSAPYSNSGEEIEIVECKDPVQIISTLNNPEAGEQSLEDECKISIISHCHKLCRGFELTSAQVNACLLLFSSFPSEEDTYSIMHIFKNKDEQVKTEAARTLISLHSIYRPSLPIERFQQLTSEQSPELQVLMKQIIK